MTESRSPAVTDREPLSELRDEVDRRLAAAESDIAELQREVARLDRDLDESRRLNLRAAELLDIVYQQLTGDPDGSLRPSTEPTAPPQAHEDGPGR
jgi:hypothetical protein